MNSEDDVRIMYTQFNQGASAILFNTLSKFRQEADRLQRRREENVFQLLRAKYINSLKHDLVDSASQIISGCNNREAQDQLRMSLSEKLHYYLREFSIKSEQL